MGCLFLLIVVGCALCGAWPAAIFFLLCYLVFGDE